MSQYIFLTLYIVVSAFLLFSAYLGIFRPNNNTVYGVFCQSLMDDKIVAYLSQIILAIISAAVLIYIEWYLLATAVIINMFAVLAIEYLRLKKRKESKSTNEDESQDKTS